MQCDFLCMDMFSDLASWYDAELMNALSVLCTCVCSQFGGEKGGEGEECMLPIATHVMYQPHIASCCNHCVYG